MELMNNLKLDLILGNSAVKMQSRINELEDELQHSDIYQEIQSLKNDLKIMENSKKDIEKFLINTMLENGMNEFEFKDVEFKIKKGRKSKSIEVEDLELIPAEFLRIKKEADKNAIKKYVEETGVLIAGTNYIEKIGEPTLEIKSK